MALSNFNELKAQVKSWLHRDDIDAKLDDFITLAESRLGRKLSLLAWESQAVLPVVNSEATLPPDYKQMRNVMNDGYPMTFMTPAQFAAETRPGAVVQPTSSAQNPYAYTVLGADKIKVGSAIADGADISIEYIARLDPLSVTNPTSWLLTNHPDLMLYGSLEAGCSYVMDSDSEAKWAGKFMSGIRELRIEDDMSRGAGAPLQIRGSH